MIGVFLGMDVGLRTEASTASEVVGVLDHVGFDAHNLGRIKWVHLVQFKDAEDRRFGRDRAVVAFEREMVEAIQFCLLPIDVDRLVERLSQST